MKENSSVWLEFPKAELKCAACQEKDRGTFGFLIASDVFAPFRVEVVELQNEYLEAQGLYRIKARIRWKCPSCGIPLDAVTKVRDIPVEVIKHVSSICPKCGNPLKLADEKIVLSSNSKLTDTLTITGHLVCTKCTREEPISTKIKANFRPVWKFMSGISKIKISGEGLEFERETKP